MAKADRDCEYCEWSYLAKLPGEEATHLICTKTRQSATTIETEDEVTVEFKEHNSYLPCQWFTERKTENYIQKVWRGAELDKLSAERKKPRKATKPKRRKRK